MLYVVQLYADTLKGYFPATLQSAANFIRPWSAVSSKDVKGMSASMAAKEAQRRAQLLSQARKFERLTRNGAFSDGDAS